MLKSADESISPPSNFAKYHLGASNLLGGIASLELPSPTVIDVDTQELADPLLDLQRYLEKAQNVMHDMLQGQAHDAAPREEQQREQVFLILIQQEMHKLQSSLSKEVRTAKADLLASFRQECAAIQTLKADILISLREDLAGIHIHKERPDADGSPMMPEANVASLAARNGGDASCAPNSQWESTWLDLSRAVTDIDRNYYNAYVESLKDSIQTLSIWHKVAKRLGLEHCLHRKVPNNVFARVTEHPTFAVMRNVLILVNACLMAYEADVSIKQLLEESGSSVPEWIHSANQIFTFIFAAEVFSRMLALGSWFWVAPIDWAWNMFDLLVVVASLASDYFINGKKFTFFRTIRILRATRSLRLVRVLRFFRPLRKMLFAILASLSSLVWCFAFLSFMIFMFTILFLQGLVEALKNMDPGTSTHAYAITRKFFDSVSGSMFSLLAAVTGGESWVTVREPLTYAGQLYTTAYLLYVLFVVVGVMNVLTGVFLASSDEFTDRHTIIQNEQIRVSNFVTDMLEIFREVDENHQGEIDWPTFQKTMHTESVQAYLAAHEVEPTHARVMFDLLDEEGKGTVNAFDWTMGMVRMMGSAKAVDARIIQRQVGLIPNMLKYHFHKKPVVGHASNSLLP